MKQIALGAEASLSLLKKNGTQVVEKKRISKKYRNTNLDKKIRKERTKTESNLLRKCHSIGLNVPKVLNTDLNEFIIEMEFIPGTVLKKSLNFKNLNYCSDVGKNIALMHSNGIIHGDITTSNLIEFENKIFFIDFGLGFHSKKTEDFAVDLLNFKRTFNATHSDLKKGWEKIIQNYEKKFKKGKEVLKRLKEVEKRGKYQ